MKKTILLLGFTGVLSGCATSEFSCGQFPKSGCQSVSHVYENSNEGVHDYRKALYKEKEENSGSSSRSSKDLTINVGQAHRALNYSTPGDPILTKPVIMRILFNSWEDTEKDLNAGGYVYVKLRDSEWVIQQ